MTNEAGTENKAGTKKRPGTRLMVTGLAVLALGILLVIVGFSTTHMEMAPGTFRTKEVPGAPTPAAWIILLIGVILSAVGFGKRVLASIEK